MNKSDELLKSIQKTNPEMTKEILIKKLKRSDVSSTVLFNLFLYTNKS